MIASVFRIFDKGGSVILQVRPGESNLVSLANATDRGPGAQRQTRTLTGGSRLGPVPLATLPSPSAYGLVLYAKNRFLPRLHPIICVSRGRPGERLGTACLPVTSFVIGYPPSSRIVRPRTRFLRVAFLAAPSFWAPGRLFFPAAPPNYRRNQVRISNVEARGVEISLTTPAPLQSRSRK